MATDELKTAIKEKIEATQKLHALEEEETARAAAGKRAIDEARQRVQETEARVREVSAKLPARKP